MLQGRDSGAGHHRACALPSGGCRLPGKARGPRAGPSSSLPTPTKPPASLLDPLCTGEERPPGRGAGCPACPDARRSPANHDRPPNEGEHCRCPQHSSYAAAQPRRQGEAREGRLQGRQLPGAWRRQHRAPWSALVCPLPSPSGLGPDECCSNLQLQQPRSDRKGEHRREKMAKGKTAKDGETGPEPGGRARTEVGAVWHPSVRHFVLTGHRAQQLPLLREESSDLGLALPQVLLPALTGPG